MSSYYYKCFTDKYSNPDCEYQCNGFSSIIKNTSGYVWPSGKNNVIINCIFLFGAYSKYEDIRYEIHKATSIPFNAIVGLYKYSKTYYNESRNYDYYDFEKDTGTVYALIDLSKDPSFQQIDRQTKNLENNYNNLQSQFNDLCSENWKSQNKINTLISQNQTLTKNYEKEKNQMTRKNNELLNDINSLRNQYQDLKSNSQNQINNIKRIQEEEKNQMNEKNRKLEKDFDNLKNKNENLKNQYESLNKENQERKTQLNNLMIQHNNLKKKTRRRRK